MIAFVLHEDPGACYWLDMVALQVAKIFEMAFLGTVYVVGVRHAGTYRQLASHDQRTAPNQLHSLRLSDDWNFGRGN